MCLITLCLLQVAIKSIRKERLRDDLDRAHIQREIEITASLTHPNIIRLYEGKTQQYHITILFVAYPNAKC